MKRWENTHMCAHTHTHTYIYIYIYVYIYIYKGNLKLNPTIWGKRKTMKNLIDMLHCWKHIIWILIWSSIISSFFSCCLILFSNLLLYVYIYICVCVWVYVYIYIYIYIYIHILISYIYIYIYMCVCVCEKILYPISTEFKMIII